ncbi:AAA family ATPase [Ramlibacter albus]|uniref:AAA family ATPase n=1 Tax=Ramlibacter albus TaxID=2079448 RepID=A0A923MFV3_9BURK|nr:AAA family ATPase [Ramlibacter albus]MBC5768684.1 AAA family ATPase [Ramlibacter albus]
MNSINLCDNQTFIEKTWLPIPRPATRYLRFTLEGERLSKAPLVTPELPHVANLPDNGDNYLSVSSFVVEPGQRPSIEANYFAALHTLVLVRLTSAEVDRLAALCSPTWVMRLACDDHQIGFVLTSPLREVTDARDLVERAKGYYPDRVVDLYDFHRLPHGTTTLASTGPELLVWQPETTTSRFTLQDALRGSVREAATPTAPEPATPDDSRPSAFTKYSLRGHLDEVERVLTDQRPILGRIVARNQATCLYAAPSTGKTLITLHLIAEAIVAGVINPSKLLYVNMDDNPSGLVEKGQLAEEYGFHMLADGYRGFNLKQFQVTLRSMIETQTVDGTILVLDTLKKFVDTMSKQEARQFTNVVRKFVTLGGTVIALSHTNKALDANGKPVYSGTTDIIDDFDCVFIVSKVDRENDKGKTVVVFENKKSRGTVASAAAFSYASGKVSYPELFASVQEVDPEEWQPYVKSEEQRSDGELVEVVTEAINAGIRSKMLLAAEVSRRTGASRQAAIRVIEKYAESGSANQRWTFKRGARGVHQYELVTKATAPAA